MGSLGYVLAGFRLAAGRTGLSAGGSDALSPAGDFAAAFSAECGLAEAAGFLAAGSPAFALAELGLPASDSAGFGLAERPGAGSAGRSVVARSGTSASNSARAS